MENPIRASVDSDFKLHKCNIIDYRTPLLECFTIENPIDAIVNSDLKLNKLGISPKNII